MSDDRQTQWWQKSELLTGTSLVALLFVVLIPLTVRVESLAFGVPLGYFLAVIVVPVAIAGSIFAIAGRQERMERRRRAPGE